MDIIDPPLIWIGKCCYRITNSTAKSSPVQGNLLSSYGGKEHLIRDGKLSGEYEIDDYEADEVCNENFQVDKLVDGRFRSKLTIASDYFPRIIGRNGDTKRQIEKETRTQILIPKKGQVGDIVITGLNHKGVCSARRQISLIVSSARKRMPFTHFISIPLISADVKAKFLEFKKQVLAVPRSGLDEELFQKQDKLHLTLATLVLLTEDERKRATLVLNTLYDRIRKIIGNEPFEIEIRGVECMNDDPEQVDVLYGRCMDESGRLQAISDLVVDELEAEGLLDRQYSKVKLHATLMNSLFKVKDDEEGSKRITFNAKLLLEKWRDYSFGWQSIDVLHLSQRYSTSSSGYYLSTAEITLKQEL